MPADTTHPEYEENIKTWNRISDCLAGQDTIKRREKAYLPMLKGQETEEYTKYLNRALFFNATARTHEAMLGFLFRKPPELELSDRLENDFAPDADLAGAPLMAYARKVSETVCSTGRGVTLVEWSEDENRPYFAFYPAESVINWRTERIGGNSRLTLLVLKECTDTPGNDPFAHTLRTRYRACRIDEAGNYIQEEYAGDVIGTGAVQTLSGTGPANETNRTVGAAAVTKEITRRGVPLQFISAVFHSADNFGEGIGRAPLADLTSINISQFQTSADLENGRHFCGLPTPWARCFGEAGDKLYLGMSHAWSSTDPQAMCGFLEFQGQGLSELTKAMEEKQSQMAAIGARLVEARKSGVESAEALGLRASAETSTLTRIGNMVSETLSMACQMADWWMGAEEERDTDIKIVLNKDFTSAALPPEMLTALVAAFQSGSISWDTFFNCMQKGEMYKDGWTSEEERDSIEANPPIMPPMPTLPGTGKTNNTNVQ